MRKKVIISFFTIYLVVSSGYAQFPDYHVQLFNEKSGLQTFLMRGIARDQNGFSWLLHHFKAQRFDGKVESQPADKNLTPEGETNYRGWSLLRSNLFINIYLKHII